MTDNRLKELMSAATASAPPIPFSSDREGRLRRLDWQAEVEKARNELLAELPDLLATIARLESENADLRILEATSLSLWKAAEKRVSEADALLRDYMFAEEIDDPAERGGELLVCRNKVETFLTKEPTNANG